MADRLRIVKFQSTGRVNLIQDINISGQFELVRDTLSFTSAPSNKTKVQSGRRWEGEKQVGESHGNANVSAEWYINSGSKDASKVTADNFLALLTEPHNGYYVEWRPDGSTYSVFMEIRGTSQPQLMYRWIEWNGTATLHVSQSFETAPLAVGEKMKIDDDFLRPERTAAPDYGVNNGMDEYNIISGSGHLQALPFPGTFLGELITDSTGTKQAIHVGKGYTYGDHRVSLATFYGASTTSGNAGTHGVFLKWIDASNWIRCKSNPMSGGVTIETSVAGVVTTRATGAITGSPAMSNSVGYVTATISGNVVTARGYQVTTANWFTSGTRFERNVDQHSPVVTTPITSLASYTLTGTEITALGLAVEGRAGFETTTPTAAQVAHLRFMCEPFVYTNASSNGEITMHGKIPGTAPALASIEVGAAYSAAFALFALWPTPDPLTNPVTAAGSKLGYLDSSTLTSPSGTPFSANAGGAGATFLGGDARQFSWTGTPRSSSIGGVIPPYQFAPDDFSNTVAVEIWMKALIVQPTTLTYTLAANPSTPLSGTLNPVIFSAEFGTVAKSLVGDGTNRLYRLGTLLLPASAVNRGDYFVQVSVSGTGTGSIKVDYLAAVPARSRAAMGTGTLTLLAGASGYLAGAMNPSNVKIHSSLATSRSEPASELMYPGVGLSGAPLLLQPGVSSTLFVDLEGCIPNAPIPDANGISQNVTTVSEFAVDARPRWHLLR